MQNVEFHNLYCVSDTGVSKNSGKVGEECGMDGNEGNLADIFYLKKRKERVDSEDLREYGRIILRCVIPVVWYNTMW